VSVEPELERRIVHFAGRVQGVGFRFITRSIAGRHPVTGFVQNLSDGRVRIVVEGAPAALDAFVADVAAEMDRYIESRDVTVRPATGEFSEFEIKR
jgi:acylphosphatase